MPLITISVGRHFPLSTEHTHIFTIRDFLLLEKFPSPFISPNFFLSTEFKVNVVVFNYACILRHNSPTDATMRRRLKINKNNNK